VCVCVCVCVCLFFFSNVVSFVYNQTAISLSSQLDSFKEYIGKLNAFVGENRTKFIIANSIFFVEFGSNDISNTYFISRVRQIKYPEFSSYADFLVNLAANFTKVSKHIAHSSSQSHIVSSQLLFKYYSTLYYTECM
jgi:hypothetical protein